jgi:hypothetical protein
MKIFLETFAKCSILFKFKALPQGTEWLERGRCSKVSILINVNTTGTMFCKHKTNGWQTMIILLSL